MAFKLEDLIPCTFTTYTFVITKETNWRFLKKQSQLKAHLIPFSSVLLTKSHSQIWTSCVSFTMPSYNVVRKDRNGGYISYIRECCSFTDFKFKVKSWLKSANLKCTHHA